jgi:hypothetical protein
MKNKETEIKIQGSETGLLYSELITSCISVTPREGREIDEMRKVISVADAMEKLKKDEEIKLKAEEALFVKTKVSEFRWAFDHKDIIAFCDEVKEL